MKEMMLQTILLCCLCLVSCSDSEENRPVLPPDQEQEEPETPDRPHDYTGLMNKTNSVPANYEQEAEQRGEVVRVDYDTHDYAEGTGVARTNTAYVYLPYGYDEHSDPTLQRCFTSYTDLMARRQPRLKRRTGLIA